jgi:hypothetical protein
MTAAIVLAVAVVLAGIGVPESARPEKVAFVYGKGSYPGIISYRDIRGTHSSLSKN